MCGVETFVVRLATQADEAGDAEAELHGVVQRVRDGEETTFGSGAELLEVLQVAGRSRT